MTFADTSQHAQKRSIDPSTRKAMDPAFWVICGLSLLVGFAVALPNLADPMIRHDDFPAYFARPDMFWNKTLHEGRWLNWIWHMRGIITPSWLNFAVSQALWALFAAGLSMAAMGREPKAIWLTAGLAALIIVSPSARVISLWFNTIIPGVAVVALYALLANVLRQKSLRVLLLPFTVVSFMAYTTYPVLLLIVCLVRTNDRSLRDLLGLLAWFTLCFGVAVLTVYTINLQVHGVFGVPLDEWRNASPAQDLAGLVANIPLLGETLWLLSNRMGFAPPALATPSVVFLGLVFVAATIVLAKRAPMEALYLHAGLWTGMALMVLQCLQLGLVIPSRAFVFVWVVFALLLVRSVWALRGVSGTSARMMRNAVVIVLGAQVVTSLDFYGDFRAWQNETRALASDLAQNSAPVLVYGDVESLPSAERAALHHDLALSFRLTMLTGREVFLCDDDLDSCAEWRAREDGPTPDVVRITKEGDNVILSLNR